MQRSLVEQAAAGDQRAFEALVRQSAGRLFAIAYRILRDHDRAEDALQQALVTIWDEFPRLRDPDRFEAWSYRLIVRASLAHAGVSAAAAPSSSSCPTTRWPARLPRRPPTRSMRSPTETRSSAGSGA